jgi:hypothetical protein
MKIIKSAVADKKEDDDFEIMEFLKKVKTKLDKNPNRSTQELYEETRVEHRATSNTVLPDFRDVQSGLNKRKAKMCHTPQYASSDQIIVKDKFTANRTNPVLFNFFDNNKRNRSFGFASPTGLQALSESKYYHADGTFHTKTRCMAQLNVIHAYFPATKFNDDGKVWQKRMIPCGSL